MDKTSPYPAQQKVSVNKKVGGVRPSVRRRHQGYSSIRAAFSNTIEEETL